MSGEKTEPPTPKKLREARKKGQVAKSNDLTQAFLFLVAAGVLSSTGPGFVENLELLLKDFFAPTVLSGSMAEGTVLTYFGTAWLRMLLLLAPLFGALFMVSLAINYVQVKSLFSLEIVKPKFDKLNPVNGFKNIFFKAKTYIELAKNILKFAVIFALLYFILKGSIRDVIVSARMSPLQTGQFATGLLFDILFRVGGVFVLIGAADYMLQHKQWLKELKMSKYEVEKEFKQDEGDPHIKHQRRHLHQELLSEGAAINEVPNANVVVVNPTHLAIALRYDEKSMGAPRVTCKGRELIAHQMIATAKRHKVPVLRNVPLAHSLIEIETGRDIPEDLYEAVAEVLNFVYQLAQAEAQAT